MEITGISAELSAASELFQSNNGRASGVSFEQRLFQELNNVNQAITDAENNIQDLALNRSANIHEVLLSINKAKTSLEMMMTVRTKTLEGLQEILRMQI